MTVSATESSKRFHGSGNAGPFDWSWRFLNSADVLVYLIAEPFEDDPASEIRQLLIEDVDYSIEGAGSYDGGSVTLLGAVLGAGADLVVERDTAAVQSINMRDNSYFSPDSLEDAVDRLTMIAQDRDSKVGLLETSVAYVRALLAQGAAAGSALLENFSMIFKPRDLITRGPWLDARSYSSLADADAAAVADGKVLLISSAWNQVPAALNASIKIIPGGLINAAGPLSINGDFSCGASRCFTGAGAVTFTRGIEVNPLWWGAAPIWFGVVDGNTVDSTAAIQAAINSVRASKGTVRVPVGKYKITAPVQLSDGPNPPPNFIGEHAKGVVFVPTMLGDTPCFIDRRTVVTFPDKTRVENFTVQPATPYTGTAIKVCNAICVHYRNIYVNAANYGIWLLNDTGGLWTELNSFYDVWLDACNEAIRLEILAGADVSFHGNDFINVSMNILANQTGIHHVSGYYYNSRFDFKMWTLGANATVFNVEGNAENNIGTITLENQNAAAAKIVGAAGARWWFTGEFNYAGGGGLVDQLGYSTEGASAFSCSNYITPGGMAAAAVLNYTPSVATYNAHGIYNGNGNYGLFRISSPGVVSHLVNCFAGSFYLGQSGYNGTLSSASIGVAIRADGGDFQTFNPNGMSFTTGANQYAFFIKAGQFYICSPDRGHKILSAMGNPEGLAGYEASPGAFCMANNGGTGTVYFKQTGTGNTGWVPVAIGGGSGTGNAATLNGFSASQTPVAGQIPVLKGTGSLVVPGNIQAQGKQLQVGLGKDSATTPGQIVYSDTIACAADTDVLLLYNDAFSGTITVTYNGVGALSVKSFTISASDGRATVAGDFLKLRAYAPNVAVLGTPYIKLTTAAPYSPHLYIPIRGAVAGGTLTVTFVSDMGHHPWFLPAGPMGALGATTYPLTGV